MMLSSDHKKCIKIVLTLLTLAISLRDNNDQIQTSFRNTGKKSLGNSASFIAIESMIQKGWVIVSFTEFEKHLDLLEEKGLISASEHQALLVLARKLGIDQLGET